MGLSGVGSSRQQAKGGPTTVTTPSTISVPYGFCHCMCGQMTNIASKSDRSNGHVRGRPIKFIRGHAQRKSRPPSEFVEIDGKPYRTIPLTRGQVAVVDVEDYEALAQFSWYATTSSRHSCFYAHRTVKENGKNRVIQMHQQVCPPLPGFVVDHKDRNGLHNWRDNLRSVTQAQNLWNTKRIKTNTSGFTGAVWHTQNHNWTATIKIHGKAVYLGCFDTKREAAAAYSAAVILRNEFGYLLGRTPSLTSVVKRR